MDIHHDSQTHMTSSAKRKRVLFKSSIDAYAPFDVAMPHAAAMKRLGNNSGNLLFTKAMQHYLQAASADYDIANLPLSELHQKGYDCCIVNCANWISPGNRSNLQQMATQLRGGKVPVYFIGLGAQAGANESLSFVTPIEQEVKAFIAAVLDSGGGFGLRGAFTAALFEKLGFRDFSVIGCPSMYQRGPLLSVDKADVGRNELRPVLNGRIQTISQLFPTHLDLATSEYICQDELYKYFHCFDELSSSEKVAFSGLPEPILSMILEDRVNLFYDIEHWVDYIRAHQFNYSFGSRIHGNIICILLGIPALVDARDRRTQELADHFAIPVFPEESRHRPVDLYALYESTDYTAFNRSFPERYAEFCAFLSHHDLPLKPGTDSLAEVRPGSVDCQKQGELKQLVEDILAFRPNPLLHLLNADQRFWRKLKTYIKEKATRVTAW